MKFHKLIGTLTLIGAAAMTLVACEDPRTYRPVVGTEIRTYNLNNGDNYVEMAVKLNTENVQMPEIVMPVSDAEANVNLANLTIRPAAQAGFSELLIAVNMTGAAGLEGARPVLPNGTVIPVSGVDMNQLIALPLDEYNKGGRIYLAVDTANNTAIMGAALTWETLDSFGQSVGPLNFFPALDITPEVKGIAGIFGSKTAGYNGVAIFADISKFLAKARKGFAPTQSTGTAQFLR